MKFLKKYIIIILAFGFTYISNYSITGAYDISQSSYANKSFNFTTPIPNMRSTYLNNSGYRFYGAAAAGSTIIRQYDLSIKDDISTGVNTKNFNKTTECTTYQSFTLKEDGTKLYLACLSPAMTIKQYTLTGAYDISTAVYDLKSVSSLTGTTHINGIRLENNGTKLFYIDATGYVFKYTLNTAYDISTAVYHSKSINMRIGNMLTPKNFRFDSMGTTIFFGMSNSTDVTYLNGIYQYTLTGAYDVSSITSNTGFYKKYNTLSPTNISGTLDFNNDFSKFIAGDYQTYYSYLYNNGTTFQYETCSDGIKNQGETGIDYGGVCGICSDNLPNSGGIYTPMNLSYSGIYQEVQKDAFYRANENNSGALGYLLTDRLTKLQITGMNYWTWYEGQYFSGTIDGYLKRLWYGTTSTGEYIKTSSAPFGMSSLGTKGKITIENYESGTTSIFNDDLFTYKAKRMGYLKLYGSSEGTYNLYIQYQKWNGATWDYKGVETKGWKMGQVVTFYDKAYPMVNKISIEFNEFDMIYQIQKIETGKYVQNIDLLLQCKYQNGEEVTQEEIQQSQNTNINGNLWDTGTGAGNAYNSGTGFLNTNDISGTGGFTFGTLTATTSGATCEMFSGTTFNYSVAGAKLSIGLNNNFKIAKTPWTCEVLSINPCTIAYNNTEDFINFIFNLQSNGIDKMINPLNKGLQYIGSPVDGQYYCFFGKSMKYTGKPTQYTRLNGVVVSVNKMTGFDYMLIFIMILSFIALWIKK